jgi:hypothetical protein
MPYRTDWEELATAFIAIQRKPVTQTQLARPHAFFLPATPVTTGSELGLD